MRLETAILAFAAAVSLGGCSVKKQPQTTHTAPPAPKPTASKPAEPLSVPQTNVALPPPQPVPADALPPPEPGTPPAAPPPATRPPARPPQRQTNPAPRPEPSTPPSPAQPSTPERSPVLEVLSAAESKRLQEEAHGRINEARQAMGRLSARRRNQQKSVVDRIESFLTQAQEAERRGDMRQASELAGRAAVLARELRP